MHRVTAASICVLGGFVVGLVLPHFKSSEPSSILVSISSSVSAQVDSGLPPVPAIADAGKRVIQLLKAPASLGRDVELADALYGMTKEEFAPFAKEFLALFEEQSMDNHLTEAILDHWFLVDPGSAQGAAKQAVLDPKNCGYPSHANQFASAAARHDPQWALDNLVNDLEYMSPGWSSNAAVLQEVTKKDRKLAEAWMQKFQDSKLRLTLLAGYVEGLAESDPLAAMDVAIAEKSFERINLITSAVDAAARTGANMASLVLSKIDKPSIRRSAAWNAAKIIGEESVADPFVFLREEAGLDHPPDRKDNSWEDAREVLHSLVNRNALEAVNWVMSLPKESQQILLGTILTSWSQSDPDAVLAWVREQQQNAGTGGDTLTLQFASDFGKLMAAQSLLKKGQIQQALQAAPSQMSDKDSNRLQGFVWDAVRSDPEATANWVERLPASEGRDSMVSTAAEYYATTQPKQAVAWIERIPNGAVRDSAILGLVKSFVREDPVAASEWVTRIFDPTKLEKGAEEVWRVWGTWARNDEAAAREWLASLPSLSDRTKRKLLGP